MKCHSKRKKVFNFRRPTSDFLARIRLWILDVREKPYSRRDTRRERERRGDDGKYFEVILPSVESLWSFQQDE